MGKKKKQKQILLTLTVQKQVPFTDEESYEFCRNMIIQGLEIDGFTVNIESEDGE